MSTFKADYFQLVTLKVPGIPGGNTQIQFAFDDQPDMRYARLLGIQAFFAEDMTVSQPAGIPVIPGNLANRCSLILETNDPDDIDKAKGKDGRFTSTLQTVRWYPLTGLHVNQTTTGSPGSFVRNMVEWHDRYVVWQKSQIIIANGGLGNTTDLAIILGVHYTFLNKEGNIISPRN